MLEVKPSLRPADTEINLNCQKALNTFLKRKDLGFLELPFRLSLWQDCQRMGSLWREKFDQVVVLGIGGSSLGVRTLLQVFDRQEVIVIDNVDGLVFQREMDKIKDWNRTGWVVISKSGTSIETLTALEWVLQIHRQKTLRFDNRTLVITELTDNSLGKWADENSIPRLEIPRDVGGRFSILSPVGMFPAAYLGLNLEALRQGAIRALQQTTVLTQLMVQFMMSFQRQEWITSFWFYNSRALYLGQWWIQLWAESLAKKYNHQGKDAPRVSTPQVAIGATDQHSILQQIMEGARDKFVVFWRFGDAEEFGEVLGRSHFQETKSLVGRKMGYLLGVEAEATSQALAMNGISTLNVKMNELNEESLGEWLMTQQLVVGGLGQYLEINAFDQPGVELGKRLTKEKLTDP